MEYGFTCLTRFRIPLFRIGTATALALVLLALTRTLRMRRHVTVAGVVRDTSGGVVVDAVVEALVGERVIARATNGADGRLPAHCSGRTPFALRTHRAGFADDVIALDGADK